MFFDCNLVSKYNYIIVRPPCTECQYSSETLIILEIMLFCLLCAYATVEYRPTSKPHVNCIRIHIKFLYQ